MILNYISAQNDNEVPVKIELRRVKPEDLYPFMVDSVKDRNHQCLQGKKPCVKYGVRPCCPPKLKLFTEFPKYKYMYLVKVSMEIEDYCEYSPKTAESPRKQFLFMNMGHMTTRNIVNRTVSSFDGQPFRVGGCLGCTFTRDGRCKRFMPPLEGTGLDLHEVVKEFFGVEIDWTTETHDLSTMTALGGLLTNREITKGAIFNAARRACNQKED